MGSLVVSGFDVREVELPPSAQVLLPPLPFPAQDDFHAAVVQALEVPQGGEPLSKRVTARSRLTVVLDDLAFPVPRATRDARATMLAAVLRVLEKHGIPSTRVTVLVGNGLSRQWRQAELIEWLGPKGASLARCHDAEALGQLARLEDRPEGPVELSRLVVDTDLVVHLSVASMPIQATGFGLVHGTLGARTARLLNAPHHFTQEGSPLAFGSSWQQAHDAVGTLLGTKVPVLQVTAVVNNELWPPAIASLLERGSGLSRPLQMWNALPEAVRHRAARMMRSSYAPIGVFCGPPSLVAPRALELFLRQHEVKAKGGADVLLFGLPDLGPYSLGTAQNPLLVANLALGFVGNLLTAGPLLKPGGVVVMANPMTKGFAREHRVHEELFEKVLKLEREPEGIHERYEPWLAGRPEFVADYQQRYAFHGAHALLAWAMCTPLRRRASRIIVAHGDPRACARFGFMAAADVEDGLKRACEALADAQPKVTMLELPPPFFVRVT